MGCLKEWDVELAKLRTKTLLPVATTCLRAFVAAGAVAEISLYYISHDEFKADVRAIDEELGAIGYILHIRKRLDWLKKMRAKHNALLDKRFSSKWFKNVIQERLLLK